MTAKRRSFHVTYAEGAFMASYTYEQLKVMTVAQLREIADGIQDESLKGHSTMHKEQLLPLLCKSLGIATHHAVAGQEKVRIKATIHKLKTRRDELGSSAPAGRQAVLRQQIHALKRRLRRIAARSG